MNDGWVKLFRSLPDWEWWGDKNTVIMFIYLLVTANHEDRKWRGEIIPRGSLITGRKQLADGARLTEREARTALEHLEKTQNVTIKTTSKFTMITICNYDRYQSTPTDYRPAERPTNDQQTTNKRPTNDQQTTTNKNIKNIRIEELENNNISLTPARAREDEGLNSVVSDDIEQMKEKYRAELCGNTMANEAARRIYGLTNEQLSQALDIFTDKLVVDGDTRKAYGEYRKYFGTWLKVNAKRIFFNTENTASNGNRYQYTPGADLLNEVAEGFAAGM